jgi:chaperone BCS1
LNALDGVRSQEGRILFMTTNHKEKLDPALLRPGRCDIHVKLDNASHVQITNLFTRFFPGEDKKAEIFANSIPDKKFSMAKMQGHLLKYRNDINEAVENYGELLNAAVVTDNMTMHEYLERLNLSKYTSKFIEERCYYIGDLKFVEATDL